MSSSSNITILAHFDRAPVDSLHFNFFSSSASRLRPTCIGSPCRDIDRGRRIVLSQEVLWATYVAPNSCAYKNDSDAGESLRVFLHMQANGVASIPTAH